MAGTAQCRQCRSAQRTPATRTKPVVAGSVLKARTEFSALSRELLIVILSGSRNVGLLYFSGNYMFFRWSQISAWFRKNGNKKTDSTCWNSKLHSYKKLTYYSYFSFREVHRSGSATILPSLYRHTSDIAPLSYGNFRGYSDKMYGCLKPYKTLIPPRYQYAGSSD